MIFKPDLDNDNISGYLGNKMFIIAAMLGYANKHNCGIGLPPFKYQQHFPYLNKCINIKQTSDITYCEPYYHYKEIPYHPVNFKIQGFFQSYKYFEKLSRDDIKHYFVFSEDIQNKAQDYMNKYDLVDKSKTVIQIRRGDYITNLNGCYHICNKNYYDSAIKKLDKTEKYLIFSDDIPWCKETFKGDQFHFVETKFNVLDVLLQSMCNQHIIGNSTFGWWGAYLNTKNTNKVIVPKGWFGPKLSYLNDKDLIPPEWERI
jgi:hypothetical protein